MTDQSLATADNISDPKEPTGDTDHLESNRNMSIITDEDDASAMTSKEDTLTCAGKVVTSSRPEENSIPSQISIVDLGD